MKRNWFTESNRWKHFVLAVPVGMLLTILCALGLASGMEFKDVHVANGNKPMAQWSWKSWDWLDWSMTVLGGLVGQAVTVGILFAIFK